MCDCDLPYFFETYTVKARKTHVCYECGTPIAIGDSYWVSSGLWDRRTGVETFHTCIECEDLRARLATESKCCVPYGEIYEHLMEQRHGWGPDGRAFWRKHRRWQEQQKQTRLERTSNEDRTCSSGGQSG